MSETEAATQELEPLKDPVEAMRERGKSPELAAVLAWLIPGAGHIYAGHKVKGAGGLVFILGIFMWGLLLSKGEAVWLEQEKGHQYAFLAQIGAGGPTLLGLAYSHEKLPGAEPLYTDPRLDRTDPDYAKGHPDRDTGLLFTMIAGLLNLLLVHDALGGVPGGHNRRIEERRRRRRLDDLRAQLEEEKAEEQANGGGDSPSEQANAVEAEAEDQRQDSQDEAPEPTDAADSEPESAGEASA